VTLTLLIAAALAPAAGVAPADQARFVRCAVLAERDPSAAVVEASNWRVTGGGGSAARQCLGLAYAALNQFQPAATAFTEAAQAAGTDGRAAGPLWVQAGNAWLLADRPADAREALTKGIAAGESNNTMLGEAHLDRARAAAALSDWPAARQDLDQAQKLVPADPMAWLLSAALARRMEDLPRARTDIAQALKRDAKAPEILIEAGNIALMSGDRAAARKHWTDIATNAPSSPLARAAEQALAANPVE
jgi:tetratricopeptide (TPR) repeat protein